MATFNAAVASFSSTSSTHGSMQPQQVGLSAWSPSVSMPPLDSRSGPFDGVANLGLGSSGGRHLGSVALPDDSKAPRTPPRNSNGSGSSATTPFHFSSGNEHERAYVHINDVKLAVKRELEYAWTVEDAHTAQPLHVRLGEKMDARYPELQATAKRWLDNSELYENEWWTQIPETATKERSLYNPIRELLNVIVTVFGQTQEVREQPEGGTTVVKTRQVKTTWNQKFSHTRITESGEEVTLKSCPDIGIFGTGPSATCETELPSLPEYSHMATPIEVKLDVSLPELFRQQVAVYGREIFIQQPNRLFVYVPLMTQTTLRVIQFDRSGAHASSTFDYHQNPILFIKLVLLFSSLDEELLGYDTSIFWRGGYRFMEVVPDEIWDATASYWRINEEKKKMEFEILGGAPFFVRKTIRSRGTVCWRVKYGDEELLVKDYWMADGRTAEWKFLQEVADIKSGIAHMHCFNNERYSTYGLREWKTGPILSTTDHPVAKRMLMRIVLNMYGSTLEKAPSALRLLSAVRDIVCGHRAVLLEKKILHRDISINNLLLTPNGGTDAGDGVLIDFDMAKKVKTDSVSIPTEGDTRTGTRAFQSVKILLHSDQLRHDHMDDLESIFYVLFYVCYGHDRRGKILPPADLPLSIEQWTNPLTATADLGTMKKSFLLLELEDTVSRFEGKESELLDNFMDKLREELFKPRVIAITAATSAKKKSKPTAPSLDSDVTQDYKTFLDIVDGAITQLKALPPVAPPSPIPSERSTDSNLKRSLSHDDPFVDSQSPKRRCADMQPSASPSVPPRTVRRSSRKVKPRLHGPSPKSANATKRPKSTWPSAVSTESRSTPAVPSSVTEEDEPSQGETTDDQEDGDSDYKPGKRP
ncbi:hypothetical protein GGX14DRAFT_698273 [Mycena pura]|uniref:Protein kinase domain-containing protein n=1 Tax=Mycena pura TaxID=153505 RepID=A0AAD6Y9J9_9AGAR|nr:hypothetical protein GGX14DRAFT_698273 [Mycena pura]